MPRTGRAKSKTKIYHLILRGINKQTIFEDDEDRIKFIQTFKECKNRSSMEIFAYCLMSNHIHLLIKEGKEDLGITMRRLGAMYVYWYNWKYDRCGHLFQDRYKSENVEDRNYLLTALRYIHQNPVKAGIVNDINDYRWSSYTEYIGNSGITDKSFILSIFGENGASKVELFAEYHKTVQAEECLEIDESKRIYDEEAKQIIARISGMSSASSIQLLDHNKRNELLKKCKREGLSTRQIARLTGISRGIILKA